jgi:hypothetical protein
MAKAGGSKKSMTKSEIATQLAEKVGISKKQATQFLQAQAELAYGLTATPRTCSRSPASAS